MTRSDGDRRLLLATALSALGRLVSNEDRAILDAELSPAERDGGLSRLSGGTVRVLPGRTAAYVDDPAALREWAVEHDLPDLLADARLGGEVTAAIAAYGEDIPGLRFRWSDSAVFVPVPAGAAIAVHQRTTKDAAA